MQSIATNSDAGENEELLMNMMDEDDASIASMDVQGPKTGLSVSSRNRRSLQEVNVNQMNVRVIRATSSLGERLTVILQSVSKRTARTTRPNPSTRLEPRSLKEGSCDRR